MLVPQRWTILLVGVLLAGCAQSSAAPEETLRPVADAPTGETVSLFTEADLDRSGVQFAVLGAVPLPDGSVLVSYDPNGNSGGDDREPFPDPRLAFLGANGALEELPRPELDGTQVGAEATLLAGAADGTVYLWDHSSDRVVVRDPDGRWRVVPIDLVNRWRYAPLAAVGADGALYLVDDRSLRRVDTDGSVATLANVDSFEHDEAARVPLADLPAPVAGMRLPPPVGLAVGPDGTVFLNTSTEIVGLGTDGQVRLVISLTDMLAQIGAPDVDGDGFSPRPQWLGIDRDGALLVSDVVQRRIVRIGADDTIEVVGERLTLPANGQNAAFSPHGDLVVVTRPWVELAAFGR